MAEKVLLIALSPTMATGTIAKWNKKEGDQVLEGDLLCEVETDKATMDYESTQEGTLLKILVPEGKETVVGAPIAILGKPGEDIDGLLKEMTLSLTAKTEAHVPGRGEQVMADAAATPTPELVTTRVKASPLAKKLARKAGLPLPSIQGSGPGGRIVKRDIEATLQQPIAPDTFATAISGAVAPIGDEVIPVSQTRRIIARRLTESKFSAPHYYLKVTVKMDNVIAARNKLNATLENKVSMNAFLLKFVAETLKRHPMVNATWNGDSITKHGQIDIGLAVAIADGLITPVVRNCGAKGIVTIDQELKILIEKAQRNRLMPEEYSRATFTISNLGSFGIEEFTAIINPPGSAILAVGAIKREPVIGNDDEIFIQSDMKLTLSCDHRIVDGAVGAAFLKQLKDIMEEPVQALY